MAEMAPPRLHELPSPVKPDHEKERRLKIRSQCREAAVQREQGFHHTSFIPAIEAGHYSECPIADNASLYLRFYNVRTLVARMVTDFSEGY
jgi:hypothetical protein